MSQNFVAPLSSSRARRVQDAATAGLRTQCSPHPWLGLTSSASASRCQLQGDPINQLHPAARAASLIAITYLRDVPFGLASTASQVSVTAWFVSVLLWWRLGCPAQRRASGLWPVLSYGPATFDNPVAPAAFRLPSQISFCSVARLAHLASASHTRHSILTETCQKKKTHKTAGRS